MLEGKRIIAFTPYGREVTVSILHKYLERDHNRGLVDEWWLLMNTDDDQYDDRLYAYSLSNHNDWIKVVEFPEGLKKATPKQLNTGTFYRYMTDPDTVYLRFDDDIVYVHEDAVENLALAKLHRPEILVAFPIIWNNAICSWHLQVRGFIPYEFGTVGAPYCMDPVGWADGPFAEKMHNLLISHIKAGTVSDLFMHVGAQLDRGQQFSVSCFAITGDEYAAMDPPGYITCEEEHWHTIARPFETGKSNVIVPNSLVSHFTFFPQRRYIMEQTDLLAQYKELADKLDTSDSQVLVRPAKDARRLPRVRPQVAIA